MIAMSRRELERLEVVHRVAGRRIKQGAAAYMLGLSVRQVKRLAGAHRQDGAAGLGRASVGASNAERNLTRLRESLIEHSPLPPHQIYAMPVEEDDLESAAARYAGTLQHMSTSPVRHRCSTSPTWDSAAGAATDLDRRANISSGQSGSIGCDWGPTGRGA
jgi:hypothetical protein